MFSVELGVTVALLELTLGVVAGNVFHLHTQDWLDFIASFASIVLTFLAGMEVDPALHAAAAGASVGIGVVSFVGPFVVASAGRAMSCSTGRSSVPDRRHRTLHDLARGRLRGSR